MAVCVTPKNVTFAVTALLGCGALGEIARADSIDVMSDLLRDARSSFARMVPLELVPTMPALQPPAIQHPAPPPQPAPPAQLSAKPQATERMAKPRA
ncbi:MAG: hypothetical protein WA418_24615, partial [Bradyrhizobium sp.]